MAFFDSSSFVGVSLDDIFASESVRSQLSETTKVAVLETDGKTNCESRDYCPLVFNVADNVHVFSFKLARIRRRCLQRSGSGNYTCQSKSTTKDNRMRARAGSTNWLSTGKVTKMST